MGMFSRLAQSTYLLSQAFDLFSLLNCHEKPTDFDQQIVQLRRTLHALIKISEVEATERELRTHSGLCPQFSLCYR